MKAPASLRHPAVALLACLLVPLSIDLACAINLDELFPAGQTVVIRASGVLVAIAWGWAGLLMCILLGILMGLPIAGLQATYLRVGLARIEKGQGVQEALRLDWRLLGFGPWLLMAAVAFIVGWAYVFPPLGGTLMAVNVLWARTLVYHPHLLVHEYLQVAEELEAQEMAEADPDLLRLRPSA